MTPDEAERKRASDRIHQRYSRARKKTQFDQLKAQNAVLTARLEETEKKLKQLQENHEALRALHRTPPQQAVAQCEHQLDAQVQPENLTPLYAPDSSSSPSFLSSCASANPVVRNDLLFDMSIDFGTGLMVDLFNDNSLGLTAPFNSLSDASELWPANNQPNPDSRAIWANSCGTAVHATLEIEHESNNRLAPIDTERLEIWESVPLHLPPVTSADYVLIGVSESGRKWSRKRGEPYRELSQQSFPSISSLLNPTTHDEASNPVSAAVGKHTTWDTSVISFPSRVAYHYIVAHMVRWLVCRTEDRFNQLPGFLKPTHLQRTVPHPAWVDMFPWPEGRDLIIQHMDYSKFDLFQSLTANFSVNWPHPDSDLFFSDASKNHMSLNPAFVSHIRDGRNWTFSPEIVESFPFMKECPTAVDK